MATASPTVLLNLNASPWWVGNNFKIDPPTFTKGRAGGSQRAGQRVTFSTPGNRTIVLPLHLKGNAASQSTAIEALCRQVANDGILKVQLASNPVFFKTFGNPGIEQTIRALLQDTSTITLEIEAEPYAYGIREEVTGSPWTLSNDPAAATNPCKIDMTNIKGDAPTPLLLLATSTGATNGLAGRTTHFASRRRGDPTAYANAIQAEAMTFGTSTAAAVDASMSGGNKATVTPGTATHILRASDTFPANGVSTIEARGEYRVYARLKKVAGEVWTVQLKYGLDATAPVANDIQTLTAAMGAGPYWVDLGKVPVPLWSDPVSASLSGVAAKVLLPFVGLYAGRTSGTGVLDIDCLYFMPADEPTTLIARFPVTDTTYAIDGTTDAGGNCYAATTTLDEIIATVGPVEMVGGGGFPELIPGSQVNRLHILRNVDSAGSVDGITNTTTLRGYYQPRWLAATRT